MLTPPTATPDDFRDPIKRIQLAQRGVFSIDQPRERQKRANQRALDLYIEGAYVFLGHDRRADHEAIAEALEAGKVDGIWAKSTGEYSKRKRSLDREIIQIARKYGYGLAPAFTDAIITLT
ncbi:hypothetical protein [Novosphingobium meiothermophilum]|uniref:hypothetical protein n=1 Tax=Novosphingobium meiothermophilum TaxID=2202251 RepID=UPI000D6DC821|nr:hypothetical protein [Novosphingobium meiothermophilum]